MLFEFEGTTRVLTLKLLNTSLHSLEHQILLLYNNTNVWHIKHDKNINHNHYYFWVLIPNVTSNNMAIVATMKQPLQWNVDWICDGSRDLHRDPKDCCFSLSSCELISFDISVWSLWRASWFVYPFCSVEGKLSCNINGR